MVQQQVESTSNLQGLRVLLAEQDWNIAELLLIILKEAQAEVIKTSSANAALSKLIEEPIDLLICNIQLPDMDGQELIQKIRSRPEKQINRIPAIAVGVTVNSYSQVIAEYTTTRVGFDGFIALPANPAEIVNAILALTEKSRGK